MAFQRSTSFVSRPLARSMAGSRRTVEASLRQDWSKQQTAAGGRQWQGRQEGHPELTRCAQPFVQP